jgi:hypothetical protein
VNSLFPEEKAAIGKLWEILLIEDADKYEAGAPSTNVSMVDGYSVNHFQLPIAQLSPSLQATANRIQLTFDSDSDASTIGGADIAEAYADKDSYLPAEINHMRNIAINIAQAAPRLPTSAQRLELSHAADQVLVEVASVKLLLRMVAKIEGAWARVDPGKLPDLMVTPTLKLDGIDADTSAIALDSETGADVAMASWSNAPTVLGAASRIEVWSSGQRVGQFDAVPGTPDAQPIPFSFDVNLGAELHHMTFNAAYGAYTQGPASQPALFSGSYSVAGHPQYRLDIFDNGRAILVDGGQPKHCYPNSGPNVAGCVVLDGGQPSLTFTLHSNLHSAIDSPDTGFLNAGNHKYGLYPY